MERLMAFLEDHFVCLKQSAVYHQWGYRRGVHAEAHVAFVTKRFATCQRLRTRCFDLRFRS